MEEDSSEIKALRIAFAVTALNLSHSDAETRLSSHIINYQTGHLEQELYNTPVSEY